MIRLVPVRAARAWHCTVVGTLLAAAPLLASSHEDPREWLQKMSQALATRNYDGTFFHLSDGRVEAMRITHSYQNGRATERLQSLEGAGREYIRKDGRLTCYLPDKHRILVETSPGGGPFLSALPRFGDGADQYYRIDALPDARVLGKPVHVIVVSPKDHYRFGYRLWLDAKTAMPLKTQLCDSRGRVLEQILFASLKMPKSIPARDLEPNLSTVGMQRVVQNPAGRATPGAADFRAAELPPGFHLTVAGAQTIGTAKRPAEHLVYSDGLATVSVFVEPGRARGAEAIATAATGAGPQASAPMHGLARLGAGFAFSTVVQGHQVTAVGEVPAETVEFIAQAVKAFGDDSMPQPRLPPAMSSASHLSNPRH